jgi:putative ABC transport system permease protein
MAVLHKKLLRTILTSWGQSLAVAMVMLCGIASYVSVYSAYLNLGLTRDTYYAHNRLADFEIMLERAPLSAVFKTEEIPGVREARGRIVKDVNVDIDGVNEPRTGRLISMPSHRHPVINDLVLLSGRYFEPGVQNEVILSDRFARENGLDVGDSLRATIAEKKHTLRIVGLALSPEYVYMISNVQELIPSPARFGILWVPEEFAEAALSMKAACNNIVGLADTPDALDAILGRAEKLLNPYGVFAKVKKEDQISNRFLSDEITGLGVSAKIIPTLFLGIAAMILLVLLNRMVRTERTQIGLMKAYGYSSVTVALHYLEYALILAAAGCIGGVAVGQWMAQGMLNMYVQFYQFPILEFRLYPDVLVRAVSIAAVFSTAGALFAAVRAARIHPAESMRPEAPRSGHRIWLERLPGIWRRVSFTGKMILRNLSRNAFRAGLNVFGVMVSTGLLIMGFFSMDCMQFGMNFQFQEVQREDVKVSFQTEHGLRTLHDMARFSQVRRAEPLLQYPFEARSGWRKKDIIVIGLPRASELQKLMNFSGEEVPVPEEGLVLSERLANTLGVQPGGRLLLKPLMGRVTREREVTVRQTTQQFLGTAAYMDIEALSRILDEPFAMNAALLRIEEGTEASLKRRLKDVAGVAAVGFSRDAYQSLMDTIVQSMRITNVTLLIFAGVIAFAIIYNVTSVSLAERQRELASLRVLGLTPGEVGRILYEENVLTGVLGAALGIPFGLAICLLLVHLYDNDLYRLPFHVEQRSLVISVLSTLGFVLLANLAVRRRIQRLDLVEVLKARE